VHCDGRSIVRMANRLAVVHRLSGPSMTVDTACSSSLVAVDLAANAICRGDCQEAVVVGVHVLLSIDSYVGTCGAHMVSRRGRCATFWAEADGYARGEGCGAVVLRRLTAAVEEGVAIWSVLHGSAVNQDGRTTTLTVPNGPAQLKVIEMALGRAGVRPEEVGYVEAHGTGTAQGDPIEVGALADVFGGR